MKVRIAILVAALAAIALLYRSLPPPPAPGPTTTVTAPPQPTPSPAPPPPAAPTPTPALAAPAPIAPPQTTPAAPMPPVEAVPMQPLGTPQGIGGTPEEIAADLDRISLSLRDYRTVMVENPVGNNAEITRALMGENAKGARLAPPEARVNSDGQMIDRWGTPYFFHQISATSMEIHSAGPDRKMGTEDDIVHR